MRLVYTEDGVDKDIDTSTWGLDDHSAHPLHDRIAFAAAFALVYGWEVDSVQLSVCDFVYQTVSRSFFAEAMGGTRRPTALARLKMSGWLHGVVATPNHTLGTAQFILRCVRPS